VSPRGILTYEHGKEWGKIEQVSSIAKEYLEADDIFNLYYTLKQQYCANASFLLNRVTLHKIRTLKDNNTGRYLWAPSLSEANPDILLGVPVYHTAEMPIFDTNALVIALADFKQAYKIIDRMGVRVLRDIMVPIFRTAKLKK